MSAINARSLYFPFTRAVGFFSNIVMIGVGGYFDPHRRQGSRSGKLLLFRAYWWRLFGPVQTLARVNDMVQRAVAAGRRVFEVLDAPDELPDAPDAMRLERIDGAMALEDVTFRYATELAGVAQPSVLSDVSIEIRPGQTVALCGPSGSGKSTILNLLLALLRSDQRTRDARRPRPPVDPPREPAVALCAGAAGDVPVQRQHPRQHSLRPSRSDDGTGDRRREGRQCARVHRQLPGGYDTKVGERGVRLSGGQKQRISIARAFLANPTVLLLDEPTSSVEPDSEAAIIAALDRLMAGRTTVLTSHRPSLINQADVVYVIEEGRVTEQGTPADLMRNGGWFARFMRSAEEALPETELAEGG